MKRFQSDTKSDFVSYQVDVMAHPWREQMTINRIIRSISGNWNESRKPITFIKSKLRSNSLTTKLGIVNLPDIRRGERWELNDTIARV